MKPFNKRPDYKPSGMWKCRACRTVQHGSTLYLAPEYTVEVWTCSDLSCGGVCDRIPPETTSEAEPVCTCKKMNIPGVGEVINATGCAVHGVTGKR